MKHLVRLIVCLLVLCVGAATSAFAQSAIPIKNVTASSFDERGPHRPWNTLSDDATRWSAKGKGQWIQYEFDGLWTVTRVDLAFFQRTTRRTFFDLAVSRNCRTGWRRIFSGHSLQSAGATVLTRLPQPFAARCLRLTGQGTSVPRHTWVSLESVRVRGDSDPAQPRLAFHQLDGDLGIPSGAVHIPTGYVFGSNPDAEDPEYGDELKDALLDTSFLLPAYGAVEFAPSQVNDIPLSDIRGILVYWRQPATFDLFADMDGVITIPLLETSQGAGWACHTIPSRPPIPEEELGYWLYLAPRHQAELVALALLETPCETQGRPFPPPVSPFPLAVSASSFQDLRHTPGNTLDRNTGTRWSAFGQDEWLSFTLVPGWREGIGIRWHQGTQRTAFFDVYVDGQPVLTDMRSRRTAGIEWYAFPEGLFSSTIEMVGHGNSVNDWNSIVEVTFAPPSIEGAARDH